MKRRTLKTAEEKLNEAKDTLSTIIHSVDNREPETRPEVVIDVIRQEAVDCLDRIRQGP